MFSKFIDNQVFKFEDYYNTVTKDFPISKSRIVEVAAKTCYHSYDKMNYLSDQKMVKGLIKSDHLAMIEFCQSCFEITESMFNMIKLSSHNEFFNYSKSGRFLISGNMRSWRNWIVYSDCEKSLKEYFLYILKKNYEIFFFDIEFDTQTTIFNCGYQCREIFDDFNYDEYQKHKYYHFVLFTDRAVLAEITRHRKASFAVQSQRYVDYKNCEFVKPHWYDNKGFKNSIYKTLWKRYCKVSAFGYYIMRKLKLHQQDARGILPNATKTIINICGNLEEMKLIFDLRCAKSAHPDIRIIANKMKEIVMNDHIIRGMKYE